MRYLLNRVKSSNNFTEMRMLIISPGEKWLQFYLLEKADNFSKKIFLFYRKESADNFNRDKYDNFAERIV